MGDNISEEEKPTFLAVAPDIDYIDGGGLDPNVAHESKWKFYDLLESKIASAADAATIHLWHGIMLLLDNPSTWESITAKDESYSSLVPACDSTDYKHSMNLRNQLTPSKACDMAQFVLQKFSFENEVELTREDLSLLVRALIGFSLTKVSSWKDGRTSACTHFKVKFSEALEQGTSQEEE